MKSSRTTPANSGQPRAPGHAGAVQSSSPDTGWTGWERILDPSPAHIPMVPTARRLGTSGPVVEGENRLGWGTAKGVRWCRVDLPLQGGDSRPLEPTKFGGQWQGTRRDPLFRHRQVASRELVLARPGRDRRPPQVRKAVIAKGTSSKTGTGQPIKAIFQDI